jgi:hypothetical protein
MAVEIRVNLAERHGKKKLRLQGIRRDLPGDRSSECLAFSLEIDAPAAPGMEMTHWAEVG